jgi:3-mercaptopyruvate sulfurtransferase SseA
VDPTKAPPTAPPFKGKVRLELLATRFDVDRAIDDPGSVILDVRRETEYRGSEKRARRVGTIPGAVHVFWRDHLDDKGAYRPAAEIRALYRSKSNRVEGRRRCTCPIVLRLNSSAPSGSFWGDAAAPCWRRRFPRWASGCTASRSPSA